MFVKHTDLGISEQIWKHLWIVATENKKGKVGGGESQGRGGTAIWSDSETNYDFKIRSFGLAVYNYMH